MGEKENSLPSGLTRYEGGLLARMAEVHDDARSLNNEYMVMVGPDDVKGDWFEDLGKLEVSGRKSTFFKDVSPIYGGYSWYRGYLIKKGEEGVVILRPWLGPEDTEKTEVLLLGNPENEWVEAVVGRYLDKTEAIQKYLRSLNQELKRKKHSGAN